MPYRKAHGAYPSAAPVLRQFSQRHSCSRRLSIPSDSDYSWNSIQATPIPKGNCVKSHRLPELHQEQASISFRSWEQFLDAMRRPAICGDDLTLQVAARILPKGVVVFSDMDVETEGRLNPPPIIAKTLWSAPVVMRPERLPCQKELRRIKREPWVSLSEKGCLRIST